MKNDAKICGYVTAWGRLPAGEGCGVVEFKEEPDEEVLPDLPLQSNCSAQACGAWWSPAE